MDHILISQFIDDELDLGEKEVFVHGVRDDDAFYGEALALLAQERCLTGMDRGAPPMTLPPRKHRGGWRPALALAASLLILVMWVVGRGPNPVPQMAHRFLIHAPDVETVAVLGDFTEWSPRSLRPVGGQGYWEVTLTLPVGVHRYAFLLDGQVLSPDPTVVARESDDFGGVNSILQVEETEV